MNEELKIIIKAITDEAKKSVAEVKKEIEGIGKTSQETSQKTNKSFKGIAKGAAVAVAAIAAATAAIGSLGKKTLEFNKLQAQLVSGFQAAGSNAQVAGKTYQQLFRFMGEQDTAVEAANLLSKLTTNEKDLAKWTKTLQGVYATFPDSLPIEALVESSNETARVGKVTGNLADALNWAGVSEDAFNAKLAQTNTLSEREALIRETLNGLYGEAAELYEKNNKAILEYNESQARLDTTMGAAGQAIMPLLTALNNLGSAFFTALKPALDVIIPVLANFVNWIAKGIQAVTSFFSSITGSSTKIKAFGNIGSGAAQAVSSGLGAAKDAAGGAKDAIEEAKKSTQGFDELNIVTSNTGASGGASGGSGGGGGASTPNYATGGVIDNAEFGTEVEESKAQGKGLLDSLKGIAEEMKKLFAPSISAWSDAFETVKEAWNKAKPDFTTGATEIRDAFLMLGSYLYNDFVPSVTNAFSVNLAPMIGDTIGFAIEEVGKLFKWLGGVTKETTKDIIIPALEDVKKVGIDTSKSIGDAWKENGESVKEATSGFFEKIRSHFDNFYNSVLLPLWENLRAVFGKVWDKGLSPLVAKVVDAIMVIAAEITTFYNEVLAPIIDWIVTKILPPVVNFINKIVQIIGDAIIAISNIIGGIITVIKGVIQFIVGIFTGDWSKAWEGIKNIFIGVWDIIKGVFELIISIIKGIGNLVKEWLVSAFKIAWEAIKGVWNAAVGYFQKIKDGIETAFRNIGSWFKDIFSKAWLGIKEAWANVTQWFSDIWTKIKEEGFSGVADWFKETFAKAWENIKSVFSSWGSFFSGLWDKIKSTFSKLGTSLGNAIGDAVKKGINGVIKKIEDVVNKGIGLINGAIDLINKITGGKIKKLDKLSLPRLAKGGIVDTATIAMIGEAGKEAVVPLENNTEWIDKLAEKIGSKGGTPSKIVLMVDGKELGWASINSINDITKQTGTLQLTLA